MTAGNGHRPLHILQVVHALGVGGTERVVCDLALRLCADGIRMSVGCLDEVGELGERLRATGIGVHLLGRTPGVDLGLVRRLARLYRAERIDLVHAHQYTPYFYAATACLLAPPRRVVFTEHGRHQPDRLRLRRAACNQALRPITAAYTAVSEFTRDSLVTFERMPHARIEVIYNGVDTDDPGIARAEARQRLGLPATARVVLSVGRMDRVKDFGTLVRAMVPTLVEVPDALLLIAGDGDRTYADDLRRQAETLGIARRVQLLGSRDDVPVLLAACDVFALTSVTEATSMTILEAMRAARPVVATDVGGNHELVAPGVTGLLAPAGDVARVADALVDLLAAPAQAARLGAAGRARLLARFGLPRALDAYRRLYRRVG